jgi:hypothetical protein
VVDGYLAAERRPEGGGARALLASFCDGFILPIFRTFCTLVAIRLLPQDGGDGLTQTTSKRYVSAGLSRSAIGWAALPSDGAGAHQTVRALGRP